MKKIIGLVIASMMFANIGYAEMRMIEENKIKTRYFNYYISTFCIDGYKFVATKAGDGNSLVQFFEAGNNQSAIPAKC